MASKGGKSGKGAGPGKIGVRVEKGRGGKRGLVEVKLVGGRFLGGGKGLVNLGGDDWEVVEGLARVGDYWTNGKVKFRCGKKVLEEEEWKMWEDEKMTDTFEGKGKGKEEDVEMEGVEVDIKKEREEKIGEDVDRVMRDMLGELKGEGWVREREGNKREKSEIEVVDLCDSSEGGEGLGMIEKWKEEKEAREKREKCERRKREVEGLANRGKDRGMNREAVMKMKMEFGDYEEVVGDVSYVMGIEIGLARCFVMDREIRKVVDMLVNGGEKGERNVRRMSEGLKEEEVVVRSEVVVEEGLKEKEELVRMNGVKGGRTYREVLKGVGEGVEDEVVNEKMERERMSWVEDSIEREKRSGKVVEVIMDSQEESSGKEWKKEEVAKELGVAEGCIDKVKVIGNRVKMVMKDNEVAEEVQKKIGEKGKEIMGDGVVEVKRNENWVGLVVPGMSVDMWEGNMEMLKEYIEVENDIKLMRMPRWLVNEDRRKSMRLKTVGVIIHVAKESVRVKLVEEGMKWDERVIQVKRYVEEKQLVFCTKCAMVGHNWWQCERKKLRCSICAVDGHAGWMHRCERCKVQRKGCEHYRKCAMCGKGHTVAEAREGNRLGVRAEMMRLRSLNY